LMEGIGRLKINIDHLIAIEIDGAARPELVEEAFKLVKEHNGFCSYKFGRPYQPRTTGYRSQNARIHGHCKDIAMQAQDGRWKDTETVKLLMEYLAIERGYPHYKYKGRIIPKRTSQINSYEASILCETIQQFADEHNFYLTEYDDKEQAYKSIGGRTSEEMQRDYPEMNLKKETK
jgi:hypothetical protein